ncbi:MAG: GH116 family glycosyl hydrolase [Chitinivibrionales bacterium]|nr:GH116 family glycosyl hydrolase [Chitinivibrionales bacterium]
MFQEHILKSSLPAGSLFFLFFSSAFSASVPVNKNLDPSWVKSLQDKGSQKIYTGSELATIGMPCGGICAGQLYVRGDGTLAKWLIFDNAVFTDYGGGAYATAATRPPSPIDQGFSITTGASPAIRLDQSGFNAIQFIGEYPIATIKYATTATPKPPVEVTLEVFSPFIPLNAKESALPATVMHFTVVNTSSANVKVTLTGWLKDSRVVLQLMRSATSLKGSTTNDVDTAFSLNPGEKKDMTFLVSWYVTADRFMYDNWFTNATDVTKYLAANYDRLSAQTHLFRDTYFNTSLPYWFVQRIGMPLSILATETSQWWKNGRFWAWEGVKCCEGTCTHVYNYAQAMAHVFPELERSVRNMQDLNPSVGLNNSNGLVGFRANGAYAADGQCGTVLKTYREHLLSADTSFLRANWTNVKKAMDYEITHDPDTNGVILDDQPNTYDCSYGGANTFVGSLYLAALRAAEEMARTLNDNVSAARYHTMFTIGKAWSERNLFKSNYFDQIVAGGNCSYGSGSLADQLFGQTWADQLNLGYVYSKDSVDKAFQSIYNYNWAPDAGGIAYGRTYANSGEAGLIICTWPLGGQASMNYSGEVWTGIEYQVATGMIYEGLLDQGLAIIRGIHDRYNGARHNPWNEVECSEHYGRAMASWGALLAMSGIIYDGPAGTLGFAPKMNQDNFRSFFSGAQGWGSIVQLQSDAGQENDIEVKYGSVSLRKLLLDVPANLQGQSYSVKLNNAPVQASGAVAGNRFAVTLASRVVANAGDVLKFTIGAPPTVSTKPAFFATDNALAVHVQSGVCTIIGTVAHGTNLSVVLYDLRGRKVGALLDRPLPGGSYNLRLDMSRNRTGGISGFYILKVFTTAKTVFTGKQVIL